MPRSNSSQKSKKKTRTTNYKGNVKREGYKRHQQIAQEQREKEFNEKVKPIAPNGLGEDMVNNNMKWGKKWSREYFGYYKDNAVLCRAFEVGKASPQQLYNQTKLYEKYEKQGKAVNAIEVDGKDYLVDVEMFEEWYDKIAMFFNRVHRENEQKAMKQEDIKQFLFQKLINPPKCNGKMNNLTIGFMGSIFMDFMGKSGNQYRMSLFNLGGEIHYDKDGNAVGEIGNKEFHTDNKKFKPVCEIALSSDRFRDDRFTAMSIGKDGINIHKPAPEPDEDTLRGHETDDVCETIKQVMGGLGGSMPDDTIGMSLDGDTLNVRVSNPDDLMEVLKGLGLEHKTCS